jgi:hypothetical protein
MSDSFTETTTKGWTTRIGQSLVGILLGIVLVSGSGIGLFWNEGRAVQTTKSLAEGASLAVDIDAGRIDPANEGRLVHVTGSMQAGTKPSDAEFGVSAGGLRLVRIVEMYQWQEEKKTETKKNLGGSEETVTTYSYVRGWSATPIDSSKFKVSEGHANPAMRYRGADFVAGEVTLGAFHPGRHIIERLPSSEEVRVDPALAEMLRSRVNGPVQVSDGKFYIGADPLQPRIGDMRISYKLTPAGAVSIVGRQSGSDFAEYQTRAGDRLLMVQEGTVSTADMFALARRENTVLTWLIRGIGALAMFIGFALILGPLVVVADVVPLIGSILGAGAALVALVATAALAPFIIAIAWLWYRPLISLIVFVIGVAIAILLKRHAAGKAAARKPAAAPA